MPNVELPEKPRVELPEKLRVSKPGKDDSPAKSPERPMVEPVTANASYKLAHEARKENGDA